MSCNLEGLGGRMDKVGCILTCPTLDIGNRREDKVRMEGLGLAC